jgi:hypothetical protein
MENLKAHLANLYDSTDNLIKLEAKVVKLEIYERITNLISKGLSLSLMVLLACCTITFFNFAMAIYLGKVLNSQVLGFLIVGMFYLIVLTFYVLLRKKVAQNSVKNVVLLELSKDIETYDELMRMQEETYRGIEISKQRLSSEFDSLKQEFYPSILSNGIQSSVKNSFSNVSRNVVKGAVNFILQKTLLRKSGIITKTIVPLLTNSLITSNLFSKKT